MLYIFNTKHHFPSRKLVRGRISKIRNVLPNVPNLMKFGSNAHHNQQHERIQFFLSAAVPFKDWPRNERECFSEQTVKLWREFELSRGFWCQRIFFPIIRKRSTLIWLTPARFPRDRSVADRRHQRDLTLPPIFCSVIIWYRDARGSETKRV